jgi:bifunctional ADP-heptose synthase (sugar kinase/adenylyltransferase)
MKLIFAARDRAGAAGTIVVAMDSDQMVKDKKGASRPILSWIERAKYFEYMPVDYLVEIEKDKDLKDLIKYLKPDLRVKGGDQEGEPSRFDIPCMYVRDWGLHSSTIIERISSL